MKNGIVRHPLIAGRKIPDERSEMVTQLLFGETYSVLTIKEKWLEVKIDRDGYVCWIDRKLGFPLETSKIHSKITQEPFQKLMVHDQEFWVPGGSIMDEKEQKTDKKVSGEDLITTALKYLGSPYLWGGKSMWGIDCSGFSQVVYQIHQLKLMRDASEQSGQGELIDFNEQIRPGDLAFFDNTEGAITHVGICLSPSKIIHASGCVRQDKLDHEGIFNSTLGKYTHHLRLIRRIIP